MAPEAAGTMPQLIVQVQTTVANVQDVEVTDTIQEDLAQHDLLPDEQFVDTGYVDAELLVSSQEQYGIRLLGPALSDNSWQAKAGKGFDVAHFQLDWPRKPSDLPARTPEFPLESSRRAYRSSLC